MISAQVMGAETATGGTVMGTGAVMGDTELGGRQWLPGSSISHL